MRFKDNIKYSCNTKSVLIIILLVFYSSAIASPVTHTHGNRTHEHTLPLTGISHSHNGGKTGTKQKSASENNRDISFIKRIANNHIDKLRSEADENMAKDTANDMKIIFIKDSVDTGRIGNSSQECLNSIASLRKTSTMHLDLSTKTLNDFKRTLSDIKVKIAKFTKEEEINKAMLSINNYRKSIESSLSSSKSLLGFKTRSAQIRCDL